jgi:predicted DNA-binding transcriptional regulator AlpA
MSKTLAQPLAQPLMDTRAVSALTGIAVATLIRWRYSGKNGPPWVKLSRRCLYRPEDVERWIAANVRTSTSDTGDSAA